MNGPYSRRHPSSRYRELVEQYRQMHAAGDQRRGVGAAETFAGTAVLKQAGVIRSICESFGARTLLDYGAGKGTQYEQRCIQMQDQREPCTLADLWKVERITCYDPAYEPLATLPTEAFDGVLCIDVLEHCPESDMQWIVDEVFSFARQFVFGNVACYPALKQLTSGENAHCTIRPIEWWQELLRDVAMGHPETNYYFILKYIVPDEQGEDRFHKATISGRHPNLVTRMSKAS